MCAKKHIHLLLLVSVCLVAADKPSTQAKPDISEMPASIHAPLFQGKKPPQAGALTERVTAGMAKPAAAGVPVRNFIDEQIFGRMQRDGIPHAPLATDREFIRRVTLDLTGRIPSSADVTAFLNDAAPDRRERLVARLIESPEFADKWAYFLMDTFRANGKMMRGVSLFHSMLKDSLAADRPYDDLARSVIAASAKSNYVVAAANPIVREHVEGKPGEADHADDLRKIHQMDTHDELAILFGKVFLGMNLSCIACHDGKGHLEKVNVYLASKKRTDFFRMAAFMGNTRYIPHVEGREAKMGHFTVDDLAPGYDTKGDSMLRIKRFGGPSAPKFVLTDEAPKPGAHAREELARMLTADPQFARATVNMFWAKLMGVGIVDPYDEFDLARQDPKNVPAGWELQPSHPELLNALAADFRKNGHSLHRLFSLICNSSAYQLSARFPGEWKESYTKYYARKFVRMLSAEELHDAIATATGRPGNFGGGKRGAEGEEAPQPVGMAMQVAVPRNSGELKSFMQAFGQANRGTPARPSQPSPLQPIMLMRSPVVTDRVLAAKDSRVQRLLDSYKDDGKVVDELFLATLARAPHAEERTLATSVMARNRVEGAQNVQWALLNLVEFLYNF
ncbi:MAG: DUF1553 domain-containing protein [Bryobacterales bacterium]|nr:DUF1553 domain-containing protein [Bryobacterales bacterium]